MIILLNTNKPSFAERNFSDWEYETGERELERLFSEVCYDNPIDNQRAYSDFCDDLGFDPYYHYPYERVERAFSAYCDIIDGFYYGIEERIFNAHDRNAKKQAGNALNSAKNIERKLSGIKKQLKMQKISPEEFIKGYEQGTLSQELKNSIDKLKSQKYGNLTFDTIKEHFLSGGSSETAQKAVSEAQQGVKQAAANEAFKVLEDKNMLPKLSDSTRSFRAGNNVVVLTGDTKGNRYLNAVKVKDAQEANEVQKAAQKANGRYRRSTRGARQYIPKYAEQYGKGVKTLDDLLKGAKKEGRIRTTVAKKVAATDKEIDIAGQINNKTSKSSNNVVKQKQQVDSILKSATPEEVKKATARVEESMADEAKKQAAGQFGRVDPVTPQVKEPKAPRNYRIVTPEEPKAPTASTTTKFQTTTPKPQTNPTRRTPSGGGGGGRSASTAANVAKGEAEGWFKRNRRKLGLAAAALGTLGGGYAAYQHYKDRD